MLLARHAGITGFCDFGRDLFLNGRESFLDALNMRFEPLSCEVERCEVLLDRFDRCIRLLTLFGKIKAWQVWRHDLFEVRRNSRLLTKLIAELIAGAAMRLTVSDFQRTLLIASFRGNPNCVISVSIQIIQRFFNLTLRRGMTLVLGFEPETAMCEVI